MLSQSACRSGSSNDVHGCWCQFHAEFVDQVWSGTRLCVVCYSVGTRLCVVCYSVGHMCVCSVVQCGTCMCVQCVCSVLQCDTCVRVQYVVLQCDTCVAVCYMCCSVIHVCACSVLQYVCSVLQCDACVRVQYVEAWYMCVREHLHAHVCSVFQYETCVPYSMHERMHLMQNSS